MRRHVKGSAFGVTLFVVLWCSVAVVFSPSAAAQQSQTVGNGVELNVLWRILLGTDYASTVSSTVAAANAPYSGLYYIAASSTDVTGTALAGVQPLYSLVNSQGTDHMDSLTAGEGGYSTLSTLGYVWTSPGSQAGLSNIFRVYDSQSGSPNAGDHATAVEAAPIPHAENLAYYSPDGPIGNAYARFPGTDNVLAWMTAGGVTAKSNLAVGCALWEWWWSGTEFINDYDYGRQIQIALYPAGSNSALSEAGDQYGGPTINVDARHPSPCVSFSTNLGSNSPNQATAAVPLDFLPANFGGGPNNPVIYPYERLGKSLTLNYVWTDGVNHNWPVALFQTVINSAAATAAFPAVVEAPTGYLNSSFNTYYYYRPTTGALTQVPQTTVYCDTFGYTPTNGCPQNSPTTGYDVPGVGPGAVILANGPGPNAMAMGVYVNEQYTQFVLYDNSTGTSGGQSGSNFAKWEVRYDGGISVPTWTYNTWIMTDTLQNVLAYINQLCSWNVQSSSNPSTCSLPQ